MADTKGYVQITDEQLAKSAVKYRKELLMMPVLAMASTLQHMSQRPGVIGKETVGEINGDIELGPYDEGRVDENGVSIDPRTLETFLGSVVKKFSPNSVWQTVYGNLISKGEALKNVDITRQVLAFLSAKLGANLNAVLWSAKRNEGGTKSKDLFNGFDTITKTEMDASKISLMDEEAFEKLILAYDYSTRKNSKYMVLEEEPDQIENGSYKYPALKFVRRRL